MASIQKRIASGESGDVIIGTASGVDALIRLGRGVEGSFTPLARTALGVASSKTVRATALDSPEALADLLLRASAVAFESERGAGQTGAHIARLIEQLGLTDALKTKTQLVTTLAEGLKQVAGGSVEIAIGPAHEIVATEGVSLLALLPPSLQASTLFAAGVVRGAPNEAAARDFILHLTHADAKSQLRNAGFANVD